MESYQKHAYKLVYILLISDDVAWARSIMNLTNWQQYDICLLWAREDAEALELLNEYEFQVLVLDTATRMDVFRYVHIAYEHDKKCRFVAFADGVDIVLANRLLAIGALCAIPKKTIYELSGEDLVQMMLRFHDQYCLNLFYNHLPPQEMQPRLMHSEIPNGKFLTGLKDEVPEWLHDIAAYRLVVMRYGHIYTEIAGDRMHPSCGRMSEDSPISIYGRAFHDILFDIPNCMMMFVSGENACIIFYRTRSDTAMPDVQSAMRIISNALMIRYSTPSNWLISGEKTDPAQIPLLYKQMRETLMQTELTDRDALYWDLNAESKVGHAVNRGDTDAVAAFFENRVEKLAQEKNYEQAIRLFITGALSFASKLYAGQGLVENRDIVKERDVDIYDLHMVSSWLINIYAFLIECMEKEEHAAQSELSPFIYFALYYIGNHYTNGDLRITDVSKACHVSPSYLSRTFKKETGYTFISYLNHLRIYRSLVLIGETQEAIQQISEKVGFNNYNIFFAYFKKILGVTPKEFRRAPFQAPIDSLFYTNREEKPS